jgi:hypothetical protein
MDQVPFALSRHCPMLGTRLPRSAPLRSRATPRTSMSTAAGHPTLLAEEHQYTPGPLYMENIIPIPIIRARVTTTRMKMDIVPNRGRHHYLHRVGHLSLQATPERPIITAIIITRRVEEGGTIDHLPTTVHRTRTISTTTGSAIWMTAPPMRLTTLYRVASDITEPHRRIRAHPTCLAPKVSATFGTRAIYTVALYPVTTKRTVPARHVIDRLTARCRGHLVLQAGTITHLICLHRYEPRDSNRHMRGAGAVVSGGRMTWA